MQQPLAIMVIGGLTANMLFTRMMIPVGYLILERTKRKEATGPEPEMAPVESPPMPPSAPSPETQESIPTQELPPVLSDPGLSTTESSPATPSTLEPVTTALDSPRLTLIHCYRLRML